jgi:hypothetical protein
MSCTGRAILTLFSGKPKLSLIPSFSLPRCGSLFKRGSRTRLSKSPGPLEFLIRTLQTNSGVFVRFTHPESAGDYNAAWTAVSSGFEVQIDNTGAPDGRPRHRTGAVYAVNYPNDLPADPQMPPATAGDFVNPQNVQVFPVKILKFKAMPRSNAALC